MLWQGKVEDFVMWFVSPENEDEIALRLALRSVPESDWEQVSRELKTLLGAGE